MLPNSKCTLNVQFCSPMNSARPLKPKRKIKNKQDWSPAISDFIRRPMKLDEFVNEENQNESNNSPPKQQLETPRTQRPGFVDHQERYRANKRALENRQRMRYSQTQKYQEQCDKIEKVMRKVKTPRCVQKQREFTSMPVKHIKDSHIIEHIVAQRNDDYMEISEYIPQGYVADLGALRRLPPDNKLYVKSKERIFYWG